MPKSGRDTPDGWAHVNSRSSEAMMNQIQQGRAAPIMRGRSRLSAVSRRATEYFVDPDPVVEPREQDTAEFAAEFLADDFGRTATVALPLTRSGHYEREAVEARLAELESELAVVRAAAATPTGAEAEIQYLGLETAEILRVAHRQAEELVARATAEADALRASAQAAAEATTEAAERRLRELDAETDLIWAERTRLTDDTLRLAEALRVIAASAVERFPAESAAPDPEPCP